ncbi:MAG: transposase [Saprospiraceae bacterium]
MPDIGKWQSDFLQENFDLQCKMRGRHNFLNMCRYSGFNEGTFHNNYGKDFDFFGFNLLLSEKYSSAERISAFDPSHISKSGKQTPGGAYFWSGCAGRNKWGLEIGGFASVDIINNTAMHLIANQTLGDKEYPSLLIYYAALVSFHAENLKKVSKYLAADAYFSKKPFVDEVCATGLELISRLRDDADLLYPYVGPHPDRRGAKTKYNGKLNPRNLDPAYFTCCVEEENYRIFEATLYSKAMKRQIRVAIMHVYREDGTIKLHKIYFSTDLALSGIDIYCYYKARFQIEFLYRDAKQYVGLEHCQSKSETKLHFHFNTALTTVSLVKAIYHLSQPIEQRTPFSMADVKTQYFNELMWNLIIQACGISPHEPNIISIKQNVLNFGKIRA